MPAEKLTPWFDWPTAPLRVGWYDIRFRQLSEGAPTEEYEDVGRFNWNGARFVSATGFSLGLIPGDQWRGLAEKPKERA